MKKLTLGKIIIGFFFRTTLSEIVKLLKSLIMT
jgi:hypothetical protein